MVSDNDHLVPDDGTVPQPAVRRTAQALIDAALAEDVVAHVGTAPDHEGNFADVGTNPVDKVTDAARNIDAHLDQLGHGLHERALLEKYTKDRRDRVPNVFIRIRDPLATSKFSSDP